MDNNTSTCSNQSLPVMTIESLKEAIDKISKLPPYPVSAKCSEEEKKFRICAMQEELDEYKEAKTKEDQLDALVDLVVFAMGTAERQGMLEVFDEAFKRVMIANCKKEIGQNQKRGSFQLDLVKPEGWAAPCHKDLVK